MLWDTYLATHYITIVMRTIILTLSETQLTKVEDIFDSLLLDKDVDKDIDKFYNDLLDQAYHLKENKQ